jgi:membrane fusion protein (multidrug efflux system)
MIKRFAIALVLVVLVCGGLIGFNIFRAKMISNFFANQQVPPVTVSATEVKPVTWTPEIDAIGTLLAAQGVDVATQVAGVVKSIDFKANDVIKKDQLLVQIDDAVERADVSSAQAAVERDRAQLQRARTLSKSGVSSEATLQVAEAALAVSQSALQRIRATLDLKAIEAPFAGIVGIPRVEVGQYVEPGDVIATLQQLDTMRVDFTVPEQQLADIKLGQPAAFGLDPREFPYEGSITGVDPKIDPHTRMISVRAGVENPNGELRPGQFVRVRVKLPPVDNVIALPQTSVVTSLYGDYVYVVNEAKNAPKTAAGGNATEAEKPAAADGSGLDAAKATGEAAPQQSGKTQNAPNLVATQVFVEVGRRQGNLIEITKGLDPGQTVVTSGQNKLANNSPVIINNKVDPAAIALGEPDGAT